MLEVNQNQIPDWLARRANTSPQDLALIAGWERYTWIELFNRVLRVAAGLREQGIEAGKKVALLMSNTPRFVETLHATGQLNAIAVPLNTRLTSAELAWQVADVKADLLVFDEKHRETAQIIAKEANCLARFVAELEKEEGITPREYLDLKSVHTIIYSSGTTGKPKGVMLTYGNHFWNALASSLNLGLQRDDRWLAVLPLFHVGGMSILLRSALYGIPAVLHETFEPGAINRSIEENRVTIISVVANMLQRMLDERGDNRYPPYLRCVLTGGGPVPQPLLERCAALDIPVTQTYGLTETASQVATLSPQDALRKLGSAGKALYPSELRVEQEGRVVGAGEVGEIVVRGPIVTAGYAGRPEETARALREGWLHTGDLGKIDEEGYLYVVDRRDDLIISGGENIYPAEIEAVLLSHPGIEEAGVVAVPDERWGQVPGAAVKTRSGVSLSEADIVEWCSARLARYKVPARVLFLKTLPRNAAGKLVRRHLRDNWTKYETEK